MNIDLEKFTKEELLSMVNDGLDHAKKQREEIERLKEENNNLKFTPKTRFKDVIELREENKRLLREMDNADEVIKNQFFEIERLNNIINKALEINKDLQEHLDKEYWIGRLELQEQILQGSDKE